MFDNLPNSFKTQYRCYSVSMMAGNEREDVEKGGKSTLANFIPLVSFCTPWKPTGFLMFSGGIERDQVVAWNELNIGWSVLLLVGEDLLSFNKQVFYHWAWIVIFMKIHWNLDVEKISVLKFCFIFSIYYCKIFLSTISVSSVDFEQVNAD